MACDANHTHNWWYNMSALKKQKVEKQAKN
jgi:hypothetical protein